MDKWQELQGRILALEKEMTSIKKEVEWEQRKELSVQDTTVHKPEAYKPKAYKPEAHKPEESKERVSATSKTEQPSLHKESPIPKKTEEKASIQWEKELSQKWLPRVFLFVLLLGFIWGFIAAVEEGWLTPPFRILIGFIASVALGYLGEKQIREHRHNLGISLLAGMVILLTVTTFAMNSLYGYTGFWLTFVLYAAWLGFGLWLSARHQSENLAVLVSIGGFFIPMLLDGASDQNEILFYLYEAIIYGVYLYYAAKQQFRRLHYVSFVGLQVMTFLYLFIGSTNDVYPILMLWLQHGLLLYVFFFRSYLNTGHRVSTLLTSFMLNYLWTTALWDKDEYLIVFLITSISYSAVGVWTWIRDNRDKTSIAAVMATLSIGIATLIALDDASQTVRAIVHLLQGIAVMVIGVSIKSRVQWLMGFLYSFAGLFVIFFTFIGKIVSIETLAWVLAIGAVCLIKEWKPILSEKDKAWFIPVIRSFLVIGTYTFGLNVIQCVFGYEDTDVLVGILWLMTLAYGVTYYLIAYQKESKWVSVVGHGFLLSSFIYTLQADMYSYHWETELIEWSWIHLFLWIAVLCTLVLVYKRPTTINDKQVKTYSLMKHLMTCVMTFIFVTKGTDALFTEANYVTQAIALSTAWLVYALTCIGIGRWKKWSSLSVAGMLMLFVVLIKLLFNDVPDISFALRAFLFVGLGAIGLGVSRFLYRNEKSNTEPKDE